MYQLYLNWGDDDAYYHTAFVIGVLLASTINFIFSIVYFWTGFPLFRFSLFPVGVFLIFIIGIVVYYFHKKRIHYIDSNVRLSKSLSKDDWIVIFTMIIMFSTWFQTPLLYKCTIG